MPLVLVATPIGNLQDLSPRAREALADADCICCEDTRRTGRLLELTGIGRRAGVPLVRVDDHTEQRAAAPILDRLARGERVALVTDAGTPGIADPGERLVAAALAAGHQVDVVPGPSAAVAALVVSGLPTGRFTFEGFLPRKGAARSERLEELASERRTAVVYESPHRLARTLADLADACGPDRRVAVVRELTKLHEEAIRLRLGEAAGWAASTEVAGEVVLVVEGAPVPPPPDDDAVAAAVAAAVARGLSARDAATAVARELGIPRKQAYEAALATRQRGG